MEDRRQLIAYAIVFAIVMIISIVYGIWYWNNCAFVSILDAPMLCRAGRE